MGQLTVVFDQDCGVCQASIAWLRRRDPGGELRFIGNDSPELPKGVPRDQTNETLFVVEEASGRIRTRADGIAWLLRTRPGFAALGWKLLGVLMVVPGIRLLSNFAYRIFAKHRHRVSAALGLNACAVPAARKN